MKKFIIALTLLCTAVHLFAQNVGIGTNTPDELAILDIQATDKGILIPRVETSAIDLIGGSSSTIPDGLLVFQPSDKSFYYWNGLNWKKISEGAFENVSGVVRNTGNLLFDDFVFGASELPANNTNISENLFFFNNLKAAFRAGAQVGSDKWSDVKLGLASFASGQNTEANGDFSTAMGENTLAEGEASTALGKNTIATGEYSTALGFQTEASGDYSLAMGAETTAQGDISTAMGIGTYAGSYAETVIGQNNTFDNPGSKDTWVPTDRLFTVGNGEGFSTSDAMIIYKNGNVRLYDTLQIGVDGSEYNLPASRGMEGQTIVANADGSTTWSTSSGIFENENGLIRPIGDHASNDFVFGSDALPSGVVNDTLFFFDKNKGAFRTGVLSDSDAWSQNFMGLGSFASGYGTRASGNYGVATGFRCRAEGTGATAMGFDAEAKQTITTAIGHGVIAQEFGEVVVGAYNISGTPSAAPGPSTRVFTIGNGYATNDRSNAMIVYRSGRVQLFDTLQIGDGASDYILPVGRGSAGQVLTTAADGSTDWVDVSLTNVADADNDTKITLGEAIQDSVLITVEGKKHFSLVKTNRGMSRIEMPDNNANIGIGGETLEKISSAFSFGNVAIGEDALTATFRGDFNVALGNATLRKNIEGTGNVAIGSGAMLNNVSGDQNVGIGNDALFNTTGDFNIGIGRLAGSNINSESNNVVIGNEAQVPTGSSNAVRIGNDDVTYAGIEVDWSITSDFRAKEAIETSPLGLDFIKNIRPVIYHRINNEAKDKELGIVAQELETALSNFGFTHEDLGIIHIDNDGNYTVRYNDFIAPLIKATQEQQTIIDAQNSKIDRQEERIQKLEKAIEQLLEKRN